MGIFNFGRIKQWIGLNNLTAQDLNNEFNNLFTNISAPNISGASGDPATLAGMQALENPGGVGTENLPQTIQDEIREIRYVLDQIIGAPGGQWYSPVPSSLTSLTSSGGASTFPSRIVTGAVDSNGQPMFLIPDGSTSAVHLDAAGTSLNTFINNVNTIFTTNQTVTGLTTAPSTNNTATIADAELSVDAYALAVGERESVINLVSIGSNVSARNGTYIAMQGVSEVIIGELSINNLTCSVSFSAGLSGVPTIVTSSTMHTLNTNDQVSFTGGSLPAGVTAGTIYFATVIDDANFYISSSVNGGGGLFSVPNGSGTANILKSNCLKNCFRGWFFNSSNANIGRELLTNSQTLTLLQLTWVFATFNGGVAGVAITYNKPNVSAIQPASPAIGDYWFDLVANSWKVYSGSSFVVTNAVAVGVCAQNTTECIAARSFDFANQFSTLNTCELEYLDSSDVRLSKLSNKISVYGTGLSFPYGNVVWNTTSNLDSGVTLSTFTTYYCYLTADGKPYISDQPPNQRKYDLLGDYHNAKPWRCVATFTTDGSSNVVNGSVSYSDYHQDVLPDSFIQTGSLYAAQRSQLAPGSVTGGSAPNSIIAPNTIAKQNLVAANIISSSSSGASSTGSTSATNVTNLSVNIHTSGRPVVIKLVPDGTGSASFVGVQNVSNITAHGFVQILRGASVISLNEIFVQAAGVSSIFSHAPPSSICIIDTPAAGTYNYSVQYFVSSSTGSPIVMVEFCVLVAYEM